MSAECERHGVDLHGDTFSGLVCPVCEAEQERDALVREIAAWLRHIDRLDETPGARDLLPGRNPLWDASMALERKFLANSREGG